MLLLSRQGKVRLAKWYTTQSQKERARALKEVAPLVLGRHPKLCNFVDWRDQKLVYKRYASLFFVAGVDTGARAGGGGGVMGGRGAGCWAGVQRWWFLLAATARPRGGASSLHCVKLEGCYNSAVITTTDPATAPPSPPLTRHHHQTLNPPYPEPTPEDNELLTLEVIHEFVEVLDKYFGNVCELDLIFNFHKVRWRGVCFGGRGEGVWRGRVEGWWQQGGDGGRCAVRGRRPGCAAVIGIMQ